MLLFIQIHKSVIQVPRGRRYHLMFDCHPLSLSVVAIRNGVASKGRGGGLIKVMQVKAAQKVEGD